MTAGWRRVYRRPRDWNTSGLAATKHHEHSPSSWVVGLPDVRYQVFVSSTYADLREERQAVIQALLEIDCIPAGMELFPAANEEQFSFIKRVVDLSDYYVLIIGGRYGSITSEGISYTELEYDYALETGKPVCAFVHSDPGSIIQAKTETTEALALKLEAFREKVRGGRLVKMWKNSEELPGKVAIALNHAIKNYPSPGWIRGNQGVSIDMYKDLEELRRENEALRKVKGGSSKSQIISSQFIPVTFRRVDAPDITQLNNISIEDCIRLVPTRQAEKTLSNRMFAEMVGEHLFGFADAIDYTMTDRSLDDLIFVLDQTGLAVPYEGYLAFTTKFRRNKLKLDFGIEA